LGVEMKNKGVSPMSLVLSVVDPGYKHGISATELSRDLPLLERTIKYAEMNGLYYPFLSNIFEFDPTISQLDGKRWERELNDLEGLKNTISFLGDLHDREGLDYIIIKACTTIPHVPRDVDIFIHDNQKDKIRAIFDRSNMKVLYSNNVETSFERQGYMKLDIYAKIQYISKEFIDENYLWRSREVGNLFGIDCTILNNEANFLLLFIHSLFGHRCITLLDFLNMNNIIRNIETLDVCRTYSSIHGWGPVFDMGLERLNHLQKLIYDDGMQIPFPYLFDKRFMLRCIASMDDLQLSEKEMFYLNLSLNMDWFSYELRKSPLYDYLKRSNTGRKIFNSLGYLIRSRRGDRHGIY
jgi:hypothetical protein